MKIIYSILAILILAFLGAAIYFQPADTPRLGEAQPDKQGGHVAQKEYGGPEPPTSGDHGDTVEWGPYTAEVADVNSLHNLEHGGVYVSYQPDLAKDQVELLKKLLFPPYADEDFKPLKVLMAPREANESPIVVSSWNRSMKLDSYDKDKIVAYYKSNVGKSPEPLGR